MFNVIKKLFFVQFFFSIVILLGLVSCDQKQNVPMQKPNRKANKFASTTQTIQSNQIKKVKQNIVQRKQEPKLTAESLSNEINGFLNSLNINKKSWGLANTNSVATNANDLSEIDIFHDSLYVKRLSGVSPIVEFTDEYRASTNAHLSHTEILELIRSISDINQLLSKARSLSVGISGVRDVAAAKFILQYIADKYSHQTAGNDALYLLASLASRQGEHKQAEAFCKEILNNIMRGDDISENYKNFLYLNLAKKYHANSDFNNEAEIYEQMRQNADSPEDYFMIDWIKIRNKAYEKDASIGQIINSRNRLKNILAEMKKQELNKTDLIRNDIEALQILINKAKNNYRERTVNDANSGVNQPWLDLSGNYWRE